MTPSYKWQLDRWLSFVGLCCFPRKLASSCDCLGRGEPNIWLIWFIFPLPNMEVAWSDRHSMGPVSNLDRYGSILRQQGRCRNGWWGQCQDPDQGATRHCDVRDSVCFTFPWNGPYFSNISTVHILGSSIQVAKVFKGWCILWSFEKTINSLCIKYRTPLYFKMSLVRKSCTIWHTSSQAIDLLKALYFSWLPARKTCIWGQKMQTENSSLGLQSTHEILQVKRIVQS